MTVFDCDDFGFGGAMRSGNAGAHGTLRSIGDEPLPRENAYGPLRPATAQQLTGRRPAMASLALLGKQAWAAYGTQTKRTRTEHALDTRLISRIERTHTPSHSDAPSRSSVGSFTAQVHNLATKKFESLRWQRLSKEVSVVIMRINEGHHDLLRLHHVSNEEVPTLHVLGAIVMLRVIR